MGEVTNFPLCELPPELQVTIWITAAHIPRTVVVELKRRQGMSNSICFKSPTAASLLTVCRASRHQARKAYSINVSCPGNTPIHINPELDTVYISDRRPNSFLFPQYHKIDSLSTFRHQLRDEDFNQIRHVMLNHQMDVTSLTDLSFALDGFNRRDLVDALKNSPGLQTITFNLTDSSILSKNGYPRFTEVTTKEVHELHIIQYQVGKGFARIEDEMEGKWDGPVVKYVKLDRGSSEVVFPFPTTVIDLEVTSLDELFHLLSQPV